LMLAGPEDEPSHVTQTISRSISTADVSASQESSVASFAIGSLNSCSAQRSRNIEERRSFWLRLAAPRPPRLILCLSPRLSPSASRAFALLRRPFVIGRLMTRSTRLSRWPRGSHCLYCSFQSAERVPEFLFALQAAFEMGCLVVVPSFES
jgi:hypothetical protein